MTPRFAAPSASLRIKALTLAVVLVAITVFGVSTFNVLRTNRMIVTQQERAIEGLAIGLAAAAELSLAVGDRAEMARLSSRFIEVNPDLQFIVIEGDDGVVLAEAARDDGLLRRFHTDATSLTESCLIAHPVMPEIGGADELFLSEFEVAGDPAGSVSGGGDDPSALITIASSNAPIIAAQKAQLRDSTLTALIISLVSLPIAVYVVGRITRRLGGLVVASDRISRGDFESGLSDPHKDEIGKLVDAFERMRLAIRQRDEQERHRQRELQTARDAAEQANGAKSQFLAHMSHEIRTPLNGVIGMLELLELTEVDSKQSRYMHIARSSADALLSLINDILDFSKIEAGHLEIEQIEFDARVVFESVAEMLAPRAAEKNIELLCHIPADVPAGVVGDPDKLRQMVLNLVNNAVKFTESGEIVIRLSVLEQGAGSALLRVSVSDTGIGIPKERRDRLFKPFSQVDASTTRRFGGTGLGLAICKSMSELMGGEIGVDPDRTRGSEFWFTFRVGLTDTLPESCQTLPASLDGVRVLVIDDNHTNQEILLEALGQWGTRPSAADDGPTALRMLREAGGNDPFMLAVLDMQMPDMDGAQVADAIQSDPDIPNPCIVMLTSMHHNANAADLRNLGIDACLQKPAKLSLLFETLQTVLGGRAAPAAPSRADSHRPGLEGLTVLVAEDNEVNQIVVRELLASAGIECDMVGDGAEALSRYDSARHQLILMDCEMPVMDGFQATRALRERSDSAGAPIIALTANAIQGDRDRCLAAGMTDYVTKPVNPDQLFEAIARHTEGLSRGSELVDRTAEPGRSEPGGSEPERASPNPDAPPGEEGASPIDVDEALARCAGSASTLSLVLDAFQRQVENAIAEIESSASERDADRVASLAHALKGAAANISAKALSSGAAHLETAAREDRIEHAGPVIDTIIVEAEQVLRHIPRIRGQLGSNA